MNLRGALQYVVKRDYPGEKSRLFGFDKTNSFLEYILHIIKPPGDLCKGCFQPAPDGGQKGLAADRRGASLAHCGKVAGHDAGFDGIQTGAV